MRILLLIHGFNALSQRVFVELQAAGHEVSIEFDINDDMTREAVAFFAPDVILCPYLKRAIPDDIWQNHLCLIVHPGVVGDRGPSALDRAILRNEPRWGVTVLQAVAEMDAGPVWASRMFDMQAATKSSLYRREVADAALAAIFEALDKTEGATVPLRPMLPALKQAGRAIDWAVDDTETVLRKIRAADGVPGLRDGGFYLYDAHEASLQGMAGEIIATSGPAICRATADGAVWIGHMRAMGAGFKLPATMLVQPDVPEVAVDSATGYREISYREAGDVGYLRFNFYNGAMSTGQIERLLAAYHAACARPTKVIVLEGGNDFWSNGIHLNTIEAAQSAADESWCNINAMDDLAEAIIRTESHLTVAAMGANAGAGGVFLARACDRVWLINSITLNPHYKDMGNLYGSEFWTYLLPRYCGEANAARIAAQRLPMGAIEAVALGLANAAYGHTRAGFDAETATRAHALADNSSALMAEKQARRAADEAQKPLADYRARELEKMRRNFFGFDPSYHVARYNFVHKVCKSRTPVTLARHRDKRFERKAS
ncbi:MAG: enoyl-CoA hydratase-related protein [Rhodobacteraceae bacterium]|nr:enoyl-CoA hydratase-related protein [Paracoccaceae bacterium]